MMDYPIARNQIATDAYKVAEKEVLAKLDRLRLVIGKHPNQKPFNFALVGDLGYVDEALDDLLKFMSDFQHERRVNGSGRQTCCTRCHECAGRLREVLDGELYCDECQMYR